MLGVGRPNGTVRAAVTKISSKLALVTLVTMFFGAGLGYVPLHGFALFPYRLLLGATLAAFVLRSALDSRDWLPPRPASLFALFFVAWAAYGCLSLAWAADLEAATSSLAFLVLGIVTSLLFGALLAEKRVLSLVPSVWLAGVMPLVAVGAWESLTGSHLPISAYHATEALPMKHMPTGFFSEPNTYATILALSFPFVLSLARRVRASAGWVMSLLVAAAIPWLLVAARSRASILALGVEAVALLVIVIQPLNKWRVGLATGVLFLTVCLAFPELPQSLLPRTTPDQPSPIQTVMQPGGSLAIRLNLIKRGLGSVTATYGAGLGPGGFEYAMRSADAQRYGGIRDMHNWWAQVLVEYGIPVAILYLAMYVGLLWLVLLGTRRARDGKLRLTGEALFCSLLGFSIAALGPSSVLGIPLQWALAGVCIAFVAVVGRESQMPCMF